MISIVVDIDTIKKACENYESVYNHIDKLYRNKLEEYKNTKVKRKLLGFNIPWTQTTLYNQLGVDSYFTRDDYGRLLVKIQIMNEVRRDILGTQPEHIDITITSSMFDDMKMDILQYTKRYKIYYNLSKLISSDIQHQHNNCSYIAVGCHEYNFIEYWTTQHNSNCICSKM